jgi:hypothetical protein
MFDSPRVFRRSDPDFPITPAVQRRLIEAGLVEGEGLAPPCGMQGNGAVFAAATSIAIPKRIDRSWRAGHASRARMPMHYPNRMQPGLSRKPTGR